MALTQDGMCHSASEVIVFDSPSLNSLSCPFALLFVFVCVCWAGLTQGLNGAETSWAQACGGPKMQQQKKGNIYCKLYVYIYILFTATTNHRKTQEPALNKWRQPAAARYRCANHQMRGGEEVGFPNQMFFCHMY